MAKNYELIRQGVDWLLVQGSDLVHLTPADVAELVAELPRPDDLLTPAQAAAELQLNLRGVYRLMRLRIIPHHDMGHRSKRIKRADLDAYKQRVRVSTCS